ncbi:hypothetical protein KAR91_59560 [Candidatus Pacearchaeota archaeon]|nr:hypothetical protein [Candidatus Pacearchaeota archaeon]
MKIISFQVKKECESLHKSILTLWKYEPCEGRHCGLGINFLIPIPKKMTKKSFLYDKTVTGWYGYRVDLGYYILIKSRKLKLVFCHHWEVIKEISSVTDEQAMNRGSGV